MMIGEVTGMLILTALLAGALVLGYKYVAKLLKRSKFNKVTLRMDDGSGRDHKKPGEVSSGSDL